ncbi:MAG: ribbon-helix-helix domain-containing protein [Shimia sp.]
MGKIELTEEMAAFVAEQVASGDYATPSDVVNAALAQAKDAAVWQPSDAYLDELARRSDEPAKRYSKEGLMGKLFPE